MKKIISQEEKDKKQKRNKIILSIFLVALIAFSSLGYAIMSRTQDTTVQRAEYAGLDFVQNNGYWTTVIGQKQLFFNKLPEDVLNITIQGEYSAADYFNEPVYIVNANVATVTLSDFLSSVALRVQDACLEEQECLTLDLPIKTCEDKVFVFKNSNETKVYKQQNCVFIEGNFFDGVDRLVYKIYGIA